MEFLNEDYDERLVRGDGQVAWLAQSQNFNALKFVMWGFLKSRVLMALSQKRVEPLV
jgi:hypothetical protein